MIRWKNRVQFVRLRLVQAGLVEKDSPRGVWEITPEGRDRIERPVGMSNTMVDDWPLLRARLEQSGSSISSKRCYLLDDRARTILAERRFAIEHPSRPLQELGDRFRLSRERVRQIEAAAAKELLATPPTPRSLKDAIERIRGLGTRLLARRTFRNPRCGSQRARYRWRFRYSCSSQAHIGSRKHRLGAQFEAALRDRWSRLTRGRYRWPGFGPA